MLLGGISDYSIASSSKIPHCCNRSAVSDVEGADQLNAMQEVASVEHLAEATSSVASSSKIPHCCNRSAVSDVEAADNLNAMQEVAKVEHLAEATSCMALSW